MGNGNYNPAKAAQVIAYLAMKAGTRSIEVLKAIKLVYLGDRDSIARWGFPILDEPRYSLPHGPVNILTYAHVNGERSEDDGWTEFLEDRRDNAIRVRDGVTIDDLDELSDADMESLDAVWRRCGSMNQWQLKAWTHRPENVPEWEDPSGSRLPIELSRIMAEVGIPQAAEVASRIEGRRTLADLLGDC